MQPSFVDAFLPAGFGRNERLERISTLIDWEPVDRLLQHPDLQPLLAPYGKEALTEAVRRRPWPPCKPTRIW